MNSKQRVPTIFKPLVVIAAIVTVAIAWTNPAAFGVAGGPVLLVAWVVALCWFRVWAAKQIR
jgi:hypothetical protein